MIIALLPIDEGDPLAEDRRSGGDRRVYAISAVHNGPRDDHPIAVIGEELTDDGHV